MQPVHRSVPARDVGDQVMRIAGSVKTIVPDDAVWNGALRHQDSMKSGWNVGSVTMSV